MTRAMRHPHGFTTIEMLFVVILISVFALSAAKLFHATMTLSRNTAAAHNSTVSFDALLSALRADVWRARRIEDAGAGAVKLTLADAQVQWSVGESIVRSEGGRDRVWTPPPGLSIAADEQRVIVRVAGGDEVWLASQILLVEEMIR